MKKNKIFDIPFIGFDYGKDNQWNFDVLIGKYGNPVIGIKINNTVEQYSSDPDVYIDFHKLLNQVCAIIGEGNIIQKIDIFGKRKYKAGQDKEFLQLKYSEHFEGRIYKTIDTLLLFSEIVNKKYKFSEKRYKEFREKCRKVFMLLKSNHCSSKFMLEQDFNYYIGSVLSMERKETPTFNNIKSTNEYLRIGKQFVKSISFVDVERIDLPNEIETYSILGKGTAADTAVDNFSFINELEHYNLLIYNQVLSIPLQVKRQRELEKKKKKHEGVAKNAPSNVIVAEEIEALLHNIAIDGQLIVDAHFSILFSANNQEEMEKTESLIDNKLFTKGIIVSKNAYNQLELFRSTIPGNSIELQDYDLFTTTSEAGLCFFLRRATLSTKIVAFI